MLLTRLLERDADDSFFEPGFMSMIEDHLTHLRTSKSVGIKTASEHLNYKYEGDFHGLLLELDIPLKYHQIVTRLNGLIASNDYKGDLYNILVPDISEVEILNNLYRTKK